MIRLNEITDMESDRTGTYDRPARLLSIEDRIGRIESLVTTYPLNVEAPSKANPGSLNALTSVIEEQARLDEKGSLHLLKDGETEFIARIGPSRMQQLMAILKFVRSSPSLSLGHFSGTAASQPRRELPPKPLAIVYVNAFFENLQPWLPFIQRSTFDHYFEHQYSDTPPSSSWYAMLNAVICLGFTSMKQASILTEDETNAALGYLNNAMSVVPDLIFSPVDTLGIQALLTMATIQNSNMAFQAASMLLSIAVRLGLAKGFHQKPAGGSINTESSIARANIFWIAYVMDKGMCIRLGHPPLIDDDEIGIDLPSKETENGEPRFLRHIVELSLIQSKVCKWMYSCRYRTKPVDQRLNLMAELDNLLDSWKNELPPKFRPENCCSTGIIGPVLNMHMAYYYAVAALHRASLGLSLEPGLEKALRYGSINRVQRVELSAQLCLSVSRATIDLLKYGNGSLPTHYVTCWSICFHVLVAALVLFVHTVNNPHRPEAHSNLAYLQLFARSVHTSPLTEKLPIGRGFSALADLIASIAASVIIGSHEALATEESNTAGDPPTSASGELPMPQMSGVTNTASLPLDQGFDDDHLPAIETASNVFDFLFQSLSPFDIEM
ncbi:hypothetical protein N7451_009698 [Penicillium sp. IBT 35674x]|nr:hypothetical protein N7451_009698 [Penicillium sp. IBT 35674x]